MTTIVVARAIVTTVVVPRDVVTTIVEPRNVVTTIVDAKDIVTTVVDARDNNNNSYTALYPVNIYDLTALYIINIKIRLTIQKHKYYKCTHQYQHDKKSG